MVIGGHLQSCPGRQNHGFKVPSICVGLVQLKIIQKDIYFRKTLKALFLPSSHYDEFFPTFAIQVSGETIGIDVPPTNGTGSSCETPTNVIIGRMCVWIIAANSIGTIPGRRICRKENGFNASASRPRKVESVEDFRGSQQTIDGPLSKPRTNWSKGLIY
jgi:hypothetical protein